MLNFSEVRPEIIQHKDIIRVSLFLALMFFCFSLIFDLYKW